MGRRSMRKKAPTRRAAMITSAVPVLVNSCAGKMGHAVGEAGLESGNTLLPYSVAGPDVGVDVVNCAGQPIQLVPPEEAVSLITRLKEEHPELIVVDYTVPAIVNAYHTYRLTSPDGTVAFEFQHNVNGRAIYAQGTVDAVLFLHRQLYGKPGGATQKLYDMIDVLEAGVMR